MSRRTSWLYPTYSQGFRPGGFNRTNTCHIDGTDGVCQFTLPQTYQSDELDELRVRLEDRMARPPPAVERRAVPGELGQRADRASSIRAKPAIWPSAPTARTTGCGESRPRSWPWWRTGLTVQGASSWNSERADQLASPDRQQSQASANFGKPITEKRCTSATTCTALNNLFGPPGGPSAQLAAHPVQPARTL